MHPNPLVYICLPCRRQSQDFAIPGVQAAKSCLWVNPSRNGQCTSKEWAKYPVKRAKTVSNLKNLFRQVLTQLPCEAHMLQHIGTAWAWVLIWSAGSIVVRMMVFVCVCKGATWVTTKRSQPTLRDLKQSLESLLLDTSRLEASRSPRYSRYSIRSSSTKMAPAPWIPYDTVRILFCFLLAHIVVLSVFSKAITVTCVYTSWVLQRHL